MKSLYKLQGVVQHYSWGGHKFIPQLIGTENKEDKPFAEYWLGAHPASPALLLNGDSISLYEAIRQSPGVFPFNKGTRLLPCISLGISTPAISKKVSA